MTRVCILTIDYGSFDKGFRVGLAIKQSQDITYVRPNTEVVITGELPKKPELPNLYQKWQQKYNSLRWANPRVKVSDLRAPSPGQTISECQEALDELEHNFQEWLNSPEFRDIDRELRMQLQPNEEVQFIITTNFDLLRKMPWDSWDLMSCYENAGVAISPSIYRGEVPSTIPSRLKILAILGNSQNINIEKDRRILERLPGADITFLPEPKRAEVYRELEKNKWDMLFFAGHSSSTREGKTGEILVNQTEKIRINEIEDILRESIKNGLKLAIFNSCDGMGIGNKLLEMKIPQAIVWRESVPDLIAHKFLRRFLTELSRGNSLHRAMRITKQKLRRVYEYDRIYPGSISLPIILQNSTVEAFRWPIVDKISSILPPDSDISQSGFVKGSEFVSPPYQPPQQLEQIRLPQSFLNQPPQQEKIPQPQPLQKPLQTPNKLLLGLGGLALAAIMIFSGSLLLNSGNQDGSKNSLSERVNEAEGQVMKSLSKDNEKRKFRQVISKRKESKDEDFKFINNNKYTGDKTSLLDELDEQYIKDIKQKKEYFKKLPKTQKDVEKAENDMNQVSEVIKRNLPNNEEKEMLGKAQEKSLNYQDNLCDFHVLTKGEEVRKPCFVHSYRVRTKQLNEIAKNLKK